MTTELKYAIIGAGPAGLAGARNLQRFGIKFDGYERHSDVGGLWDISNPHSTMYQSAHLISSKRMTEFSEFPMRDEVADYPSHIELKRYFHEFADRFSLRENYRFNTEVSEIKPAGDLWELHTANGETQTYRGVIIANGTLAEPNMPTFSGTFSGELLHSASYKSPDIFSGKRVLVVGAGNSGCDIAVDAVHYAKTTAISMRRGYHFVPKYVFGRPADTMGGLFKLPAAVKQKIDGVLLKLFTGDPQKLGFPEPDHKLYESHPIVNSLILYHAGHGDIDIRPDIKRFDGSTVIFSDDNDAEFDLIVLATGYKLHYPFISSELLNWHGDAPALYLNAFHPKFDNLFILGMVEAAGIGWQGRYELAELIARFISANESGTAAAQEFCKRKSGPTPTLSGGFDYMKIERMAYYVHKETFLKLVRKESRALAGR